MFRRWSTALLAASALAVTTAPVLAPTAAHALEPGLAFTSTALPTYQTNGIAWSIASGHGLVFVGGKFTSVRPPGAKAGTSETARTNFAVLDAATGQPTSCAPAFSEPSKPSDGTVRALTLSPDGATLYIGGLFSSAGGVTVHQLAALDIASCTVLPTFTPTPSGTVRAIAATSSAVYYGGSMVSVEGQTRKHAAAAAAVGTSQPGALLPWAPAFNADVRALALKPDDSVVVVGGDFDTANDVADRTLVAVDAGTGATVHAFPTTFPTHSIVKTIVADADGFFTGNEGTGFQVFDGRTSFSWDFKERWRDTCLGATQALVIYDKLLYAGTHAHDCSTMGEFPDGNRQHLIVESVDSPKLLPWFPNTNDGIGEGIGPRGLTVASSSAGDQLWAVGEFTSVNGTGQQGITRFGTTDNSAGPTTPVLSVTTPKAGEAQVAWQQSTDTDDRTLTYQVFRDGSSTAVSTMQGKAPFWSQRQLTYTSPETAGSTHSYKVTVSDGHNTRTSATRTVTIPSKGSAYAAQVVADGPSLYWRYDDSANILLSDSGGKNSNGTLLGGATFGVSPAAIAGDASKAFSLPGTTGYAYSEQGFPRPSAYSLETWFKTTTKAGGKIMGFGDKQILPSRNYDKMVYMTNAGKLVFGANYGTTITSPSTYNDGAWHHVVATQGTAGMVLYVDGAQVGTKPQKSSQNYTGYFRIGGDSIRNPIWPSQPASLYWKGSFDETAVYPKALSAATVATHYTLGRGSTTPTATLTPTADTYANAGATGTNYGTSSTLFSRGSPGYVTYLRFVLPAPPAGTTLKSATLRLHTTTDSSSGSGDAQQVTVVSDDWTETGLTWAERPAVTGSAIGTVAGGSTSDSGVSAALAVGALPASGDLSLAVSSTGTNAFSTWSRSYGTTSARPSLVLTYG